MSFAHVGDVGLPTLDGLLMDLGVSSFQLENGLCGFSFGGHVQLEMASEEELAQAIRDFGD
jgi:16S rRNA (cytosine1402-N4)-methyltransferase